MSLHTAFTQPIIAIYQNIAMYIGIATEAKKNISFFAVFLEVSLSVTTKFRECFDLSFTEDRFH